MAVSDTWFKRDGTPSAHYGEGNRWRIRYHGQSRSFTDQKRSKAPTPADKPPRAVEVAWARMITAERRNLAADVTVRELVDRWLLSKSRLSKSGQVSCRTSAGHAIESFGDYLAGEVTKPAVREWVATMDGGASKVHKAFQALSGALSIAVEEGRIATNPCAGIGLPKEQPREAAYQTPEGVAALAEAVFARTKRDQDRAMVWFMATTGLRIGEVCALNVGDVNRRAGLVRVRAQDVGASKSEPRDVAIAPKVLAMLDLSRPKADPLFLSPTGRRINGPNWRKRVFYKAAKLAGVDGVHPHDMRHTAVSLAQQQGASPLVVQRMVGHKRPIMTGRYSHLFDGDLQAVAAAMDSIVPNG